MSKIPEKHRLIQALLKQPVDRTPVWMMRQAGRYLPEYRALREEVPNFMEFCRRPELCCEVTLQPLRRYALDAAIVFSDILTVPEAMGMQLEFVKGDGPVIHNPVRSLKSIQSLRNPDVNDELHYVMEVVKACRKAIENKVPLIGFSGSPWTVATYMVEGGATKSFSEIKSMLYRAPEMLHQLLEKITETTIQYLNAQIEAGTQVLMVFDTWGGVLTKEMYEIFSLEYMKRIAKAVKREYEGERIPLIFYTKGGGLWLETIADSGCDAVGLDWIISIGEAKRRIGERVALQGNMDPFRLYASPESIAQNVKEIISEFNGNTGHVFNLGHGIDQHTPLEHVQAFIEAVHQYGKNQ